MKTQLKAFKRFQLSDERFEVRGLRLEGATWQSLAVNSSLAALENL